MIIHAFLAHSTCVMKSHLGNSRLVMRHVLNVTVRFPYCSLQFPRTPNRVVFQFDPSSPISSGTIVKGAIVYLGRPLHTFGDAKSYQ